MAHRGICPDSQKNPSGADVDQFLSDMKMASMSHQSLSMRAPSGHSGDVGVARGATNRGFSPWLPAPNTSNNPYAHEVRPRYCVQPDAVRGNIPRPAANLPNPSHRLSYPCVPQNVTSHLFMESPDLRAPSPRAEFQERPPALNPSQSFNLPQTRPPVDNIYRRPFENNTFQSWRTNMQDMKPQNPLPMNSQKPVVVNNEGMQSKTHYSINRTPPGNIQQYSQQVNHGQPRLVTRPYQANQSLPVVQNDCSTHNTTMEHYNVHQGNSFVSDMNHGAPSATLWNEAQGVNITGVKPNWRTGSNGNRSSEETEEKRRDQNWVDMWLQRLGKRRSSPARKSEITIADYKSYLQEALKLKAELQNLREDLSEDLSAEEFQEKMKNISKTRARLEGVNRKLTDEATLVNIERLVSKRKAKRGRLKRKRQALYQDKQTELARQSQLHKEMDTVQARLLQQSLQEKQDKEMKAAADQILGEVRRKLSETSKTIEVINSLRKLRQLRLNTKGMYLGMEADTMFQTRTDHLLSFLTDRKKTYEAEEKTLKVMLETEQEEEREREQARLREREARRTRQEHALYTQRLFGKEDQLTTADPLFPYRQFYTQAEGSLEALIAVRHGWDVCLVAEGTPGGSKIPQGWVLPPPPASPAWSTALKQ